MVSLFSGLRYVLILAATAVLFGAFLMFWEAILMLLEGFSMARLDPDRNGARRAQYFKVQESSAL